jgi:hypothetical protein
MGRTASERITASPRKTCVPGVHAWARDGETAIIRTINAAKRRTFRDACAETGRLLDAKALPLSPNRAPKILQFGLHGVIDCFAGPAQVFGQVVAVLTDVVANFIARDAIPDFTTATCRPASASDSCAGGFASCPRGASTNTTHHGRHRASAGWATPKHEGQPRAEGHPNDGGGEQIVLGVTPFVASFAD